MGELRRQLAAARQADEAAERQTRALDAVGEFADLEVFRADLRALRAAE